MGLLGVFACQARVKRALLRHRARRPERVWACVGMLAAGPCRLHLLQVVDTFPRPDAHEHILGSYGGARPRRGETRSSKKKKKKNQKQTTKPNTDKTQNNARSC